MISPTATMERHGAQVNESEPAPPAELSGGMQKRGSIARANDKPAWRWATASASARRTARS
jgi:ABC-type transporter Mla maintaining outer membrane lipid asymmetry ATPase subunit MlaF